MLKRFALAICALALTVSASHLAGTWKLNAAKSTYTGMTGNKELTVTYTMQGSGWTYSAKGVTTAGEPVNRSYTIVKDGVEAKVAGFPHWDGIIVKNSESAKGTTTFIRQGKAVGTSTRTISADGKTMTLKGAITLPDGKKASFIAVFDKQ